MSVNLDSPRKRRPRGSAAIRLQMRETIRGEILDAAEELIAARGLHGAALVQIAKRAGVAVGTLYNSFADRDALVRALFESRRTAIRPQLLAAATGAKHLPFEARLRTFVRETLAVYEAHRRFLKVAIETEHLRATHASSAPQDLLTAVGEIIAAGVRERAITPADPDVLAVMICGALKSVVLRRIADGGGLIECAESIVALFLDGARGRP
jgi:AcrR family transcriptional regulator